MAETPCGCELLRDAPLEADEGAALALADEGRAARARWRCPAAGYPPPRAQAEAPDEGTRDTIGALARVTRGAAAGCGTCPRWLAEQPHALRAARAYRLLEKGVPLDQQGVRPSMALLDALDAMDRALADRQRREAADRAARDASRRRHRARELGFDPDDDEDDDGR